MTNDHAIAAAFGETLRHQRELAGLTQEQLAEKADLDRTFISLLERGKRQPSLGTVLRLAAALGLTAAELVSLAEERRR